MRPTPTEELLAIKTILEHDIMPRVEDGYALAKLSAVIDNIVRLADHWDSDLTLLQEEIAAVEALHLSVSSDHLGPDAHAVNFQSVNQRHIEVRQALLDKIVDLQSSSELTPFGSPEMEEILGILKRSGERWKRG